MRMRAIVAADLGYRDFRLRIHRRLRASRRLGRRTIAAMRHAESQFPTSCFDGDQSAVPQGRLASVRKCGIFATGPMRIRRVPLYDGMSQALQRALIAPP